MTRGLVYGAVFWLALCVTVRACHAQTLNTRMGETEEIREHMRYLGMLSCEALQSLGERVALGVLEAERERDAAKLISVRQAWSLVRTQRMQDLTDVDDEGARRCGWDRR